MTTAGAVSMGERLSPEPFVVSIDKSSFASRGQYRYRSRASDKALRKQTHEDESDGVKFLFVKTRPAILARQMASDATETQ
jgi:hypothetical protein